MNENTLKRILSAEVMGFLLMCFAIPVLLYGLERSLRGAQTHSLLWICLAAAGIGFSAGKSKWNGAQMSAAMGALGLVGVWILGARIASPLFELMRSIIAARPQIIPAINYRFDIDASLIVSSWGVVSSSSAALFSRWQTWLMSTTHTLTVNDPLIRNMLWTFALWLLSACMGWFAAKRKAIASLMPGVLLLLLTGWSSEYRVEALWALLMLMLLSMGTWNYKQHTAQWDAQRIDYSDSIRDDISQTMLAGVVIVGLLAYVSPSISWKDVRDYFREREQLQSSEVVAQSSNDTNAVKQPGLQAHQADLPREHLLTAGYAQSKDIVMTIKTGELPPAAIPSAAIHAPRYYWRNVVYDQYGGNGWYTTSAPSQQLPANEPMIAGVLSGYKLLHLTVQMQKPEGRLHWSGMLYSADVPLTIDWRLRPQPNLFADQAALLQADMFAARTDAASYQADSFVPTPSVEQLRAAPSDGYPQHILDRYFSLPASVPARVRQLATEITDGNVTPYDKAKAIESYLRLNYPYDLQIPAPPDGSDVADYFLFDLKKGYCDYYATAMVVLARSNGIPARFVSGYASGEYDTLNAQYVVRELHAHSWAEIYFPKIGWVEFEPTGSQPEIERTEATLQTTADDERQSVTRNIFFQLSEWTLAGILVPLGLVILVVLVYFAILEPLMLARIAPAAAIENLYKRLYRSGRPLAGERVHAETAYEFTQKLIETIQSVNAKSTRASDELQKDMQHLTLIYQSSLFSNHTVAQQDVKMALMIWRRLRRALIVERVRHFFWMRNKAWR